MTLVREHLDPKRLLVYETVRWLAGRVREDESGAKSLAHVLVVVPTAQSARSLRLAIAEEWSPAGVLPPKTAMAKDLLSGDDARVATKAEELAAMAQVISIRSRLFSRSLRRSVPQTGRSMLPRSFSA